MPACSVSTGSHGVVIKKDCEEGSELGAFLDMLFSSLLFFSFREKKKKKEICFVAQVYKSAMWGPKAGGSKI